MKMLLLAAGLLLTMHDLAAQESQSGPLPSQALKKVLTLKMPKTADDDMPGTRGANVVWHPEQKKYYAVFAGNKGYPQAVFDEKGTRLSTDDQTALIDTRGLWYDPSKKIIMGNAYNDNGWFAYVLNSKGIVASLETMLEGMKQPDAQSVGAYNTTDKQVLFLNNSRVFSYTMEGIRKDSVTIHWGRTKGMGVSDYEDPDEPDEDYNATTVVYTGIKGSELGLVHLVDRQIELYDIKTGFYTKKLTLPQDVNPQASFNFAYTNGIYWFFNIERREWVGFK